MTLSTADLAQRADDGRVAGEDHDQDRVRRPRRRSYTAEYKARILDAYDALPAGSPERGALLRREGLYTSHLSEGRRARDRAVTESLTPKVRQAGKTADQVELERLRRQNKRLEGELERTKTALEITGKVHALLEQLSESADNDPPWKP